MNRALRYLLSRGLPLFFLVWLAAGASVMAEVNVTFTVDSSADAVDANPGNGVCATGAGQCTLRAAIQETDALPGADTISLPAGRYTLTIAGAGEDASATGDLDITDDLTILGAGAASTVIDGNGAVTGDRVLHIPGDSAVALGDVTLTGGEAHQWGGAIFNYGTLVVKNASLTGNRAIGDSATGGGLYNEGSVVIQQSQVSDNVAGVGAGGIFSNGSLIVLNSTISGNSVESEFGGGGGLGASGRLAISGSTITGNSVSSISGSGGGIGSGNSDVWIRNSTISGNSASDGAGLATANDFRVTVANTVISGNIAPLGTGDPFDGTGGLDCSGTEFLAIIESTISDNTGTGIHVNDCQLSLRNSYGVGQHGRPGGRDSFWFCLADSHPQQHHLGQLSP